METLDSLKQLRNLQQNQHHSTQFSISPIHSIPKIWFNKDENCVGLNASAENFLQLSRSSVFGLSFQSLFFELRASAHCLMTLIKSNTPYECTLTNGSGELKHVRVFVESLIQIDTEVIEIALFDLTHLRKDLNKLIESESKYRTFANAIPQLAWMADPSGAIFWHNERFYEFTGAQSDEILGFSWMDIIAPPHRDRFVQLAYSHIASGLHAEATLKIKSSSEGYRWCLVRAIPIKNQKGEVLRWFGTVTPLPEQLTHHLPPEGLIPDQPSAFSS